jgi:Zn-dependent alcohol dehydrogenase
MNPNYLKWSEAGVTVTVGDMVTVTSGETVMITGTPSTSKACPDCKGTRTYLGFRGFAEPCKTCC